MPAAAARVSVRVPLPEASSSWCSTWSARVMMERGIPASLATWMPKLCSEPPGASLRQEYHLAVDLGHRYVHVDDAVVGRGHLVELVVVGGKEGLGVQVAVVVDMLDDGPGDGYAVVGRGTAAELVEEYERAAAHVVEYRGGLVHLDHECRLAQRYVVRGAHAGEYLVDHADTGAVGGHVAAKHGPS